MTISEDILAPLAAEIAYDLAHWPLGPFHILQVESSELSPIFMDAMPYTKLTILSSKPVYLGARRRGCGPPDIRFRHWSEGKWGSGYDVIVCFDCLRHLADADRIVFLTIARHCLARGGRTLAIESVLPGDVVTREFKTAGKAAGYEQILASVLASNESWSTVVFERDPESDWKF